MANHRRSWSITGRQSMGWKKRRARNSPPFQSARADRHTLVSAPEKIKHPMAEPAPNEKPRTVQEPAKPAPGKKPEMPQNSVPEKIKRPTVEPAPNEKQRTVQEPAKPVPGRNPEMPQNVSPKKEMPAEKGIPPEMKTPQAPPERKIIPPQTPAPQTPPDRIVPPANRDLPLDKEQRHPNEVAPPVHQPQQPAPVAPPGIKARMKKGMTRIRTTVLTICDCWFLQSGPTSAAFRQCPRPAASHPPSGRQTNVGRQLRARDGSDWNPMKACGQSANLKASAG